MTRNTFLPFCSFLPRFFCWRRHWPHFCLHLLQTALPPSGQHSLSQTVRQSPSPNLTEEGREAHSRQRAQHASGGDHRRPRMTSVSGAWTLSPGHALPPQHRNTIERFSVVFLISCFATFSFCFHWAAGVPATLNVCFQLS